MKWFRKLKFARKVAGFTVRDVEQRTGISNAYISQLENGHVAEPSFFKMVKILRLYNLSIDDILEGDESGVKP